MICWDRMAPPPFREEGNQPMVCENQECPGMSRGERPTWMADARETEEGYEFLGDTDLCPYCGKSGEFA